MKFYLFLIIGILFYFSIDNSLKKSTRIHCKSGIVSACEAIKTQTKLVEEF